MDQSTVLAAASTALRRPLGGLAGELVAALRREFGDQPLRPAPAFR